MNRVIGKWMIFTHKEDGSSSSEVRGPNGWRASVNWRRNNVGKGRSFSVVA
jgi:hypothetical protein